MKKHTLLLFLLFLAYTVQAQEAFIQTKEKAFYGVNLIEGTPKDNALFIRQEKALQEIEYTTDDLVAYGLKGGRVFRRLELEIQDRKQAFFFEEVISRPAFKIYYLAANGVKEEFFIQDTLQKALIPIPVEKEAYRALLVQYLPSCPEDKAPSLETFIIRKNTIHRLFSSNPCENQNLLRKRIGVRFGLAGSMFKLNDKRVADIHVEIYKDFWDVATLRNPEMSYNYSAGIFFDLPIGTDNSFFHTEFNTRLLHGTYSGYGIFSNTYPTLKMTQVELDVPLLYRYYKPIPSAGVFYFEGGALLSHALFRSTRSYLVYDYQNAGQPKETIEEETEHTPTKIVSNFRPGFSLGAGYIFNYDHKFSYGLSFNYNQLYSIKEEAQYGFYNEGFYQLGISLYY